MNARVPADAFFPPALSDYQLSDNLSATKGRIFLTGTQALVRLVLMQRELRPRRQSEHRRFRQRLSRLAARHGRSAVVEGEETARVARCALSARDQRGTRRHRRARHAARGIGCGTHRRWRVRDVVRQGPGRRSRGRCAQARQRVRLVAARWRAGRSGRRPRLRVVVDAASERPDDDLVAHAGGESVERRGHAGVRPLRLGAVALLGRVDRLQGDFGDGRIRLDRRSRRDPHRLASARRFHAAGGRPAQPLARPAEPDDRSAPRREDRRRASLRPREQHRQVDRAEPARERRHRDMRQGASRSDGSAAPSRTHRRRSRRRRRAHLQGRAVVSARNDAAGNVRRRFVAKCS